MSDCGIWLIAHRPLLAFHIFHIFWSTRRIVDSGPLGLLFIFTVVFGLKVALNNFPVVSIMTVSSLNYTVPGLTALILTKS